MSLLFIFIKKFKFFVSIYTFKTYFIIFFYYLEFLLEILLWLILYKLFNYHKSYFNSFFLKAKIIKIIFALTKILIFRFLGTIVWKISIFYLIVFIIAVVFLDFIKINCVACNIIFVYFFVLKLCKLLKITKFAKIYTMESKGLFKFQKIAILDYGKPLFRLIVKKSI